MSSDRKEMLIEEVVKNISQQGQVSDLSEARVRALLSAAVEVAKPIKLSSPSSSENRTMSWAVEFRGDVYSIKPGNISINWTKIPMSTAEMALAPFGVGGFVAILALLVKGMYALFDITSIKLTDNHVVVLGVLWDTYSKERGITEDRLSREVDDYLIAKGKDALTSKQFASIINDLIKFKSIDMVDGLVNPKERIVFEYKNS